MQTPK